MSYESINLLCVYLVVGDVTLFNIKTSRLQKQLNQLMATLRTKLSTQKKTVWTLFTKGGRMSNDALSLTYEGNQIQPEKYPKFLRVTLDPGLNFHKYADSVKERASKRLNIMRRIKGRNWGASSKLLMTTYKTLIRPLIDYVPIITLIVEESNYLKLERIQRSAARNITYWPIKTSTQTIYDQIQLVDIRTRAWSLTDKYMTKALKYNDLIINLADKYKSKSIPNEGEFCKTKARPTILGLILLKTDLTSYHLLFKIISSIPDQDKL